MKRRLISKRLTALALGTILATSPLSVVANAANYLGEKPLTITINEGASITEALSLNVTGTTNKPSVTFAGKGSIIGKLTFAGHDLKITAEQGATEVDVTEATTVEIEKATAVAVTSATGDVTIGEATTVVVDEAATVAVTNATSVVAGEDVAAVEIKGNITGAVTVDGADVTIAPTATIGADLTGTVGALEVNAAITVNAELTGVTEIKAPVVLGDSTTIKETATLTVTGAAVEISSNVTIERTETSEKVDGETVTTTAPLFETGSTITSLTTGTSVDLGDATVKDLVIDATAGESIEVLGDDVKNANITIDVTGVDTATDKVEITLPSDVTEVGVVGGTQADLTVKDETGEEHTSVDIVQQAAAPTVTGEDVAFGEDITVTFDGDFEEAGLSVYYTIDGTNPLKTSTIKVEGNDVTVVALADGLALGTGVFVATETEIATFPNVDSVKIYAVVAQSGLTATAAAQTIKPSKAVELTVVVEAADYSALETAIVDAKALLAATEISEDGEDVPTTDKWVTEVVATALSTAIATAEAEIATPTAESQTAIAGFVTALETAIDTFEAAQADGKLEDTTGDDTDDNTSDDSTGDDTEDGGDASTLTHTVTVAGTPSETGATYTPAAAESANAKITFTATDAAVNLVATLEEIVAKEIATIEETNDGIKATDLAWSLTDDIATLLTLTETESTKEVPSAITGDKVSLTYTTANDIESAVTGKLDAVILGEDNVQLAFLSIDLEVVAGEAADTAEYTHEIEVTQYEVEVPSSIDDTENSETETPETEAPLQLSEDSEGNLIIEVPATGGTIDLQALVSEIIDEDAVTIEGGEVTPQPEATPLLATWTLSENDIVKISEYVAPTDKEEDNKEEEVEASEVDAADADPTPDDLVAAITTLTIATNETKDDIEVTLTVSYAKDATANDADDAELAESVEIKIIIAAPESEDEDSKDEDSKDDETPAAPTTPVAGTDVDADKIINVNATMEYIAKPESGEPAADAVWTACATGDDTKTATLTDGTYLVRYKATDDAVASAYIEITIEATGAGDE